jgi:hypothetical protein
MVKETVTRDELLKMRVGGTRNFFLGEPGKLRSAATTCTNLKNDGLGVWKCNKDFNSLSVSIKRVK